MQVNKNKTYGVFNKYIKVKYGIALLWEDNTFKWVTELFGHKEFRYEWDKPAHLFESREDAEYVATSMNCNGYSAFVVAIPDVFNFEDFKNCKEEEVNTAK